MYKAGTISVDKARTRLKDNDWHHYDYFHQQNECNNKNIDNVALGFNLVLKDDNFDQEKNKALINNVVLNIDDSDNRESTPNVNTVQSDEGRTT